MNLTYTPKDYKKHLLYSYYVISGKWKYYRVFIGTLCILNGLVLLQFNSDNKLSLQIGTIAFVYGIYYLLKPVFVALTKKYKDETVTLEFVGDNILIQDRIGHATLNLHEYPIMKNKRYYFIKLESGQRLFIPKYKLSPEQQLEFESRVKAG